METHSQLKPNRQYVISHVDIEFASDTEKNTPHKSGEVWVQKTTMVS